MWLRHAFTPLKELRATFFVVATLSVIITSSEASIFSLVIPLVKSVGSGISGESLFTRFPPRFYLYCLVAFAVARNVAQYLFGVLSARLQVDAEVILRRRISTTVYQNTPIESVSSDLGQLINHYTKHVSSYLATLQSLLGLAHSGLLFVGYSLLLLFFFPGYCVPAIVIGLVSILLSQVGLSKTYHYAERMVTAEARVTQAFVNDLSCLPAIRVFRTAPARLRKQRLLLHFHRKWSLAFQVCRQLPAPMLNLILSLAGLGFVSRSTLLESKLMAGEILFSVAGLPVLFRLQGVLRDLVNWISALCESREETKRVVALISEASIPVSVQNNTALCDLELRSIDFRYGNGPVILQNLSAQLHARETIFVTGRTGAGKSSLIRALSGLVLPTAGEIRMNGTCNPQGLQNFSVALVLEDGPIFDETLRWNLTLGKPIEIEAFDEVVASLGIGEITRSLPKGFATRVGAKGERLSHGQRQRIALGRALLSFPQCLLLDEATLPLPVDVERKFLLFARAWLPDLLCVVVTQRCENIDLADRVLNLEDGQLFEVEPSQRLKNQIPNALELAGGPV